MATCLRKRWRSAVVGAVTAAVTAAASAVFIFTATMPAHAAGTGTGYLHTSGNKIVDSTGATVRLTGLNWFGMETDNKTFHGLWANVTWKSMIDHMASLGYNTIRVPFSGDALKPGAQATSINTNTNPDLVGLSPLEILDKVVDYAGSKGMRIFLDRHRPTSAGQTALWYTSTVSEASEIADWQLLASRYANNPTVVGADLFNEPHADGTDPNGVGACWGCGDTARDWRLAAQRIGNAVLAANPHWLVIVEGVSCLSGGTANQWDNIPDDPMACDWWGGNLAGVAQFPVTLNVPNQLVYSAHDYGISVYDRQPWFNDANFPNNLPSVWDHFWGYIYKQNIAPVLVGEFGSTLANPLDTQWMTALMAYMGQGVNGMSFTYWSWNPDSGDTGGIVQDDWVTVNQNKQNIVGPYLIPPVGGGQSQGPTATPSRSSASPSASPSRSTSPSASPSASPSRSVSPSSSPTGGTGGCSVTYAVQSSWPGGFTANVTVRNNGASTLNGWTVRWTAPSGVTLASGWSATFATSGSAWTITPPTWQTTIPAGGTFTFGFQGNGASTTPTNITCS
ncbi:MAG TPA: cellulase family glycosylhydrolase [Rugosimonospora sp.]|nr:cellulase family glycosylhydrolase [Rugosimonospora sp.]